MAGRQGRGCTGKGPVRQRCVVARSVAKVGFVLKHGSNTDARELLAVLADSVPYGVVVCSEDQIQPQNAVVMPEANVAEHVDLIVALGGDGTMLRAASLVGKRKTPILGINMGRLGFLAGFAPSQATQAIEQALAKQLVRREHMRLGFTFIAADGSRATQLALNDVVIHQSTMARLVEIHAELDESPLSSYMADGLIIATPTGSTAYNLAAGGPIVVPGQSAIILTPICSHSLTERPLVVPPQSRLRLTLAPGVVGARVSVDGLWSRPLDPEDAVEITASPHSIDVLSSGRSYFDVMREKLLWGRRSERKER